MAKVKFVHGPLREKIDVVGACDPVKLNRTGFCKYYKKKSIFKDKKIAEVKLWLRRSINADEATIEEIPFEAEKRLLSKYIETNKKSRSEKYTKTSPQEDESYESGDTERGGELGGDFGRGDGIRDNNGIESDEIVQEDCFETEGEEGDSGDGSEC